MEKINPISNLFRDFLDGKMARISIGGVSVEGTLEQKCKLEFSEFYGLTLLSELRYNKTEVKANLTKEMFNRKDDISLTYDNTDNLIKLFSDILDNTWVKCGMISLYGIISYNAKTDSNGNITSLSITYTKEDTVEISSIK